MTDEADDSRLPAHRTLTAADALWSAHAAFGTSRAGRSGNAGGAHPCVAGGAVVALVPGGLAALDARTGADLWRRPLGYLPHLPLAVPGTGLVFGGDREGIFVLAAATGEVAWQRPRDDSDTGQNVYGRPASDGVRLFVGNWSGDLICLDAATGQELWRADTAGGRAGYWPASAPVVGAGVVAVGTFGGGPALGLDAVTGRERWRADTGGVGPFSAPAGTRDRPELLLFSGGAAVRLALADGSPLGRWEWPGEVPGEVMTGACGAGELTLVATQELLSDDFDYGPARLRVWRGAELVRRIDYPLSKFVAVRRDGETGRVFECAGPLVGVLDPATGERAAVLDLGGAAAGAGPPIVADGRLYVADRAGRVLAFDPPEGRSPSSNRAGGSPWPT